MRNRKWKKERRREEEKVWKKYEQIYAWTNMDAKTYVHIHSNFIFFSFLFQLRSLSKRDGKLLKLTSFLFTCSMFALVVWYIITSNELPNNRTSEKREREKKKYKRTTRSCERWNGCKWVAQDTQKKTNSIPITMKTKLVVHVSYVVVVFC